MFCKNAGGTPAPTRVSSSWGSMSRNSAIDVMSFVIFSWSAAASLKVVNPRDLRICFASWLVSVTRKIRFRSFLRATIAWFIIWVTASVASFCIL